MKGMLSSLDPHSQFMDPNDIRDMQDDTRSRINGLGIEVSMKNGLPTVVTAMEDTPAAKAGILSGDQILRINGVSTKIIFQAEDGIRDCKVTGVQTCALPI